MILLYHWFFYSRCGVSDAQSIWSFQCCAVLNVNSKHDSAISTVKKVSLHPPSAVRILLPDGRYIAYHEIGVPADKARFSLIVPHGFLSSRFTGTWLLYTIENDKKSRQVCSFKFF